MTWRDNLHLDGIGSFRGVEFLVDEAESTIGRKTVIHEYPGRDVPGVEDLGRQSRRFRLTCYVVGPHYDVERDDLREQFEKPDAGQLVHPYWGEYKVRIVSPVQIRETTAEGGLCRFTLDVVEVDETEITKAKPDKELAVNIAADAALDASADDFNLLFEIASAIESVRGLATGAIQSITQKVRAVRGAINAAMTLVDDVGDALDELIDTASSLLGTPDQLASTIQSSVGGVFRGLKDLDQDVANAIKRGDKAITPVDGGALFFDYRADKTREAMRDIVGEELEPIQETGSGQSTIAAQNQAAIEQVFRVTVVAEAARAFATYDYDSRTKALEARDEVSATIDALALDASDELYGKLVDLRAAIVDRINEIAETLPDIVEITPQATLPALVVAYHIYGDATEAEGLIARNDITDPNFVPGSVPLEILAYD